MVDRPQKQITKPRVTVNMVTFSLRVSVVYKLKIKKSAFM